MLWVIGVGSVATVVLLVVAGWLFRRQALAPVIAKQKAILHNTDPNALLAACQSIQANTATYRADGNSHPATSSHPDPNDPAIPTIIKALGPSSLTVGKEGVIVEFGGGFYHYGVTTDPAGAYGIKTRQLAPGLWYYAEDGSIPPP